MALKLDFSPQSYAVYHASRLPSRRIASAGGRPGEERGLAVKMLVPQLVVIHF